MEGLGLMSQYYEIPPGTTTRSNPNVQYFDVAGSVTILKGSIIHNGGAGMTNSGTTTEDAMYVALDLVDNSMGTQGAVRIPCVGAGEFVTVRAGEAIEQGSYVKILTDPTTTVPTEVGAWTASDAVERRVGRFFGRPSGTVTRSSTSPFNEEFEDEGDRNVEDAGTGDTIEIRVGA